MEEWRERERKEKGKERDGRMRERAKKETMAEIRH